MRIRFISMHLEYFMSFLEADIDFRETGYTIVSGVNMNPTDSAYSNGSGKSSIWEAVSWCLTGSTMRGSKVVSNLNVDKSGALVDLSFTCDDNLIRLIRSRDHSKFKTNLQIFVNDKELSGKGLRESEVILQELLPDLTSDLIGSVVILGQGLPCRLSSRTPSGRKELLEQLTKSDFMIEDIKHRLSSRKNVLQSTMESANNMSIELRIKKDSLNKELANAQSRLDSMDITEKESRYKHALDKLATLIESEQSTDSELKRLDAALNAVSTKLHDLSIERDRANGTVSSKYEDNINRITQELATRNAELLVSNRELTKANQQPSVCPTCGREIDSSVKIDTDTLKQHIAALEREISCLASEKQALSEQLAIELKNETAVLVRKIDACREEERCLREESRALAIRSRDLLEDISSTRSEKAYLEAEIQHFQATVEELANTIKVSKETLKDIEAKVLYNNKEIEDISNKQNIVSKMITLANRDFRGYLLTGVIKYIDDLMKHYCCRVFDHNKLDFRLDGNSLDILYCDRYYESLSGGEKQKIDLIIQLSVRKMLCSLTDFSSNIIVLDEIFDSMDKLSCQKIIDLLTEELCDIESIYVITHHDDLQIPCDHEIRVVKDRNGISRVE